MVASVNHRFVSLHDTKQHVLYKVVNIYAPDRHFLYFFSDPPHLIKTMRNCWAANTQNLRVCHAMYNSIARTMERLSPGNS